MRANSPGTKVIDLLMVSTSYPSDADDWRGAFIRQLVAALARRTDLRLRLWAPPGELPAGVADATSAAERAWLSRLMLAGGIAHRLRRSGLRGLLEPLGLLRHLRRAFRREEVDVVHVNWLQNALPLPRDGRPLLITALGTDIALLRLPLMTAALRHAFRGHRIYICPNATWMVEDLELRFGDLATIRCVPFGIDPAWFALERRPDPDQCARWLCVSRLTAAKLGPLFEWGEHFFAGGTRELHLFGPMQESMPLPAWVHYHGPAAPADLQQHWFPTATGLLTLSRHAEGRPQVMLEAMAAGLPVLASDLSAHVDLLRHAETGWICRWETDFGEALTRLEDASFGAEIGARARRWTKEEIGTWDDCAARYADIYRELWQVKSA